MKSKEALIIFVKSPKKGTVKTRLAKDIGDDKALEVYLMLLEHTRTVISSVNVDVFVFYHGEVIDKDLWDGFEKCLQINGDLGEKMYTAFSEVKAKGYQKVAIIGSDCAELSSAIITEAFTVLDQKDVVFGPALDGGYYLLGMKEIHSSIFENKSWSTHKLLEQSCVTCDELSLSYETLISLSDIDYLADLKKVFPKVGWDVTPFLAS